MLRLKRILLVVVGVLSIVGPLPRAQGAAQVGSTLYLPLITKSGNNVVSDRRTVHTPYFNVADVTGQKLSEMAIFWYGKVESANNYTDVRVGYNDTALFIYTASFDRLLWYDTSPATAELTQWDAISVYLNLTGPSGNAPSTSAFRFVSQSTGTVESGSTPPRTTAWQTAYRGNGAGWGAASLSFATVSGYMGSWNGTSEDKGRAMTFQIPFASLGLAGRPADGTAWALAVVTHDRDDAAGTPIADSFWPETFLSDQPSTWGQMRFGGLPGYTPPAASGGGIITVRQGLNGAVVPDAQVGGSTVCGGAAAPNYFPTWGSLNYAGSGEGNVQNQSNISDWPCFSKYYLTFPLTSLPASKAILSATLTLHIMGNPYPGPGDEPTPPGPSLIQIMSIDKDWSEATITWNNAPLAFENVGQAWIAPPYYPGYNCGGAVPWPCIADTWDISRAVAQAYAAGQPLRLVLYSADSQYHSGKYFITSDAFQQGIWDSSVLVGRPTLDVRWGNP